MEVYGKNLAASNMLTPQIPITSKPVREPLRENVW